MASTTHTTVSFDQQSMRLLRRLVEAQEAANRLKQKELELLQKKETPYFQNYYAGAETLISGDEEDGLEKEAQRESGADLAGLDQRMLEEAVAEGDNPAIFDKSLPPRNFNDGFRSVGHDPELGK